MNNSKAIEQYVESGKIIFHQEFTVSKTDSRFLEVVFKYNADTWSGCFPIYYPPLSIQFDVSEIDDHLISGYKAMAPSCIESTRLECKKRWIGKKTSETYLVFEKLLSGTWECRKCGIGKINDQPAARIRDIKKQFTVATKNQFCVKCAQKEYHDLLILFDIKSEARPEFRKPIPAKMKEFIFKTLKRKDVFFDAYRSQNEFIIDHKFPSQRWIKPETDNDKLNEQEVIGKFQLLTNQSNMLKSRECDSCKKTGKRPSFLGIKWFYQGNEEWSPISELEPESGCIGCPWYDLSTWRSKLNEKLNKQI